MHPRHSLLLLGLVAITACSQSPSGPPDGPVGSFKVTATTTGAGAKPTLLQLLVDDDEAVIIDANGSHVFEDVSVGELVARVVVPGHCVADHYSPRTVEIEEGEVAELSWAIRCPLPMASGIVFNTELPEHHLWKATPTGTQVQALESSTNDQGRRPVVNRARTRVAYIGAQGTDQGFLHIMDIDGSNDIRLPIPQVLSVDWSPDGSGLVITRGGAGLDLVIIWADGEHHSTLRTLGTGTSYQGVARWSPDGTRIAYRDGAYVYVQSLASGQRVSMQHILNDGEPAWSPDGTRIAFPDVDADEIWIVDADGSDETLVAEVPGVLGFIDWGTDNRLLFGVDVPTTGIGRLRTLPTTGGSPTTLQEIPAWATSARWAP